MLFLVPEYEVFNDKLTLEGVPQIVEILKTEIPVVIDKVTKERLRMMTVDTNKRIAMLRNLFNADSIKEENVLENLILQFMEYYDSDQYLLDQLFGTFEKPLNYLNANAFEEYEKIYVFLKDCIKQKTGAAKKPESIKTTRPKDLLIPCDIVTEKAFSEQEELYSNELVKLEVSKEDSAKKVHTMVSLSVSFDELEENGIRLSGRYTLDNFDRLVYNAVISLYLAGNESMTYKMINSVMTGNYNGRLTQKQRDAIDNSLSKMMFTRISIDTTEEYKAYKYRLQLASRNYFLPISMTREPLNGQEVDCIRVIDYPQALTYADVRKKFIRFPFELQATPVNKDQETLFLQDYLLTRISTMKRTDLSRNILYKTIYGYLKLETEFQNKASLKNKKAKIRDKVKKILDYFASQDFIKGYTENKKSNEFYSVSIILKNIPKELKS